MSIADIAAVTVALATVVGVGMKRGPAAVKWLREWRWRRDQNRSKWNALEATVEIGSSGEYLKQLKNRSGEWRRPERRTGSDYICITRESCLLVVEAENPAGLTIRNEGEGTVILKTGWRRRNVRSGEVVELGEGFGGASVYMKKAKRLKEPSAPSS